MRVQDCQACLEVIGEVKKGYGKESIKLFVNICKRLLNKMSMLNVGLDYKNFIFEL